MKISNIRMLRKVLSLQSCVLYLTVAGLGLGIPAQAQLLGQSGAGPIESYGPFNVTALADGEGLNKKLLATDGLLGANAPWSLTFWFRDSEASMGSTLLAGLGDVDADNSRYVGLSDGHLSLWLGHGQVIVGHSELNGRLGGREWHFAAVSSDGHAVTLFADGEIAGTGDFAQGTVSPVLGVAPASLPQSLGVHFGGQIADLKVYPVTLNGEQIKGVYGAKPEFANISFEDATPHWPVQTRGQAGYSEPQDPATLPRGRGAIDKPQAKPAPSGRTELVGGNPWQIRGGWKLQAAPQVKAAGANISRVGYAAGDWYAATVPGTVLTTLVDRGVYPDPDFGLNNMAIPEFLARQDYWYRVEFKTPPHTQGQRLTLTFEGVNYAAEVWLNGKRLGGFTGAFLRGNFDVTALVVASGASGTLGSAGENALAVRVSPPPHAGIPNEESVKGGPGENGGIQVLDGPTFSATEGWDWIPGIRDRNTGIWQDVTLSVTGAVEVGDLQVVTTLPRADASQADIEIEAPLTNMGRSVIDGELTASFDDVKVSKHIRLEPGETVARLEPAEFPALKVKNPRLWWPNGYGEPTLHKLTVAFAVAGKASAQKQIDFGMREVSYELSLLDETGHLRRVEVLPGRTHDAALPLIDETHNGIREVEDQTPNLAASGRLARVEEWQKHAWVHTLRAEAEGSPSVQPVQGEWTGTDIVIRVNGVRIAARGGDWGMDDSRKRVSVEHLEPFFRLHRGAHLNIIRNWMGQNTEESFYALADKYGLMVWNDFWESTQNYNLEAQDPELFLKNARDTILRYRHHPSIVVWCGRNEGVPQPIINEGLAELVRTLDHTRYYTGSSNHVNLRDSGPYKIQPLDTYYRINRGFSVELGIPSVPTLESIQSFIPKADQWPVGDVWAYHDWHQLGNGAVEPFNTHLAAEFGPPTGLEDFERKAQMLNYVGHRAIFEGFAAHLWQPNSGRMLWMTQPAWPSTEWNILSWDYDTQASFYGVQKACEPVHAQLDLTNNAVDLINLGPRQKFQVAARVEGLDGKVLDDHSFEVDAAANARTSVTTVDLAGLAAGHTVLVEFNVSDAVGRAVSNNFYWWSADESSLRELNDLPEGKLTALASTASDSTERKVAVQLTNGGSTAALMVKLTLKDAVTGDRILPAYYSDNYVSLLPGEARTVTIGFPAGSAKPSVGLRGWNLASETVPVN